MINLDTPERVRDMLDAGVAGLNCRQDMRAAIIRKQEKVRRRNAARIPVAAAAAVLVAVLGIAGYVGRPRTVNEFYAIEAGGGVTVTARPVTEHKFVLTAEDDHAILIHRGKLYRMTYILSNPAVAGACVGSVTRYTENPYAPVADSNDYISNAVFKGDPVYEVDGLSVSTAVLAEVDGQLAVFQRSGEHGYGLNGDSLLDTCAVVGQIASISLEGVGTLEGEQAEQAMSVLIEKARLENAEALPGGQALLITLKNGLRLELSMSGDQLIGCGVWDCTGFLDTFRALVTAHTGDQTV
ncbi:MAG: hypothetical protein IJ242_17185 [Clostridia bacterium]|nr:hypothetical protein [Clostridia bacterium]